MGNRRLALLVGASLCVTSSVFAQPAEGEIEMEGEKPPEPAPAAEEQPATPTPPVKDPKLAKKWQKAGEQLVRKGDQLTKQGKQAEAKQQYENAVTAYQKAVEASDDVTLNYHLALAEDKAGMTGAAMKHMQVVIAAQGVKASLVKNAQAKLDEMSMKVGIVTLMIEPDGTQVSIEGNAIGEAPLPEPLVLMPGTHKVTFTAVGFQPKDVDLKVEAGSESERKISLEPVPVVAKPQVEEPEPAPIEDKPAGPNKLPLYVGVGATGGLVLVATITGIVAIGKHGTATDGGVSPAAREDAKSSGKTLALVTDLCLVGAVGAAAFTAYWYQYKYRPQARALAERQAQAKVDVVPWVQPQAGGLSVAGQF
jgi:hypothetical protein